MKKQEGPKNVIFLRLSFYSAGGGVTFCLRGAPVLFGKKGGSYGSEIKTRKTGAGKAGRHCRYVRRPHADAGRQNRTVGDRKSVV